MAKKDAVKSKSAVAKNGVKAAKPRKTAKAAHKGKALKPAAVQETAKVLSSKVVFEVPLFRICHDTIVEPSGSRNERDVIRHNGSVVILALDKSKSKRDPWVVIERQYRHAAGRFLWELPAGKLESGEEPLEGAQRELAEETGYRAKKWKPLVEFWASPGFLGESMKVFVAEGLSAGSTNPDEDEEIDFRLVRLSEILKMIAKGAIQDGKTLSSVLLYSYLTARKGKR
jgi:ADP-ribose pyrophosphatase